MRKPIIAGNWKMNKTPAEAVELVKGLIPLVKDAKCDVVVCPTAVCLPAVAEVIKGTNIKLGAQNVHFAEKGAYTGEDLRVLCVCVSKFEEADLYGVVHELDPNAFFITQEGVTIHGNFIRKLS